MFEKRNSKGVSRVISCKLVGPDPTPEAPISDGAKVGYYNDQLTRNLLALKEGDALLVTGTYGVKDLGQNPVSIVSLQDGSYDRRLVPFMPREFQIFERHLDFHKLNQQWYVYAATARDLHERLLEAIAEAEQTARGLPLSSTGLRPTASPQTPLSEGPRQALRIPAPAMVRENCSLRSRRPHTPSYRDVLCLHELRSSHPG